MNGIPRLRRTTAAPDPGTAQGRVRSRAGAVHLIDEVITGLAARPAAEPPLTAVRQAIEQTLPSPTASTGWQACDRVLTAYPELRTTIVHGMIRNQTRLADALAIRAGQTGGSLYPQLLAGAAASAFHAAFSVWAPETGTAGLQRSSAKPLTGSPPAFPRVDLTRRAPPADRLLGRLATARSRQSGDAYDLGINSGEC